MRLIFAGTPEFAARMLRALLDGGHDVACVLTQPDRPAGRGRGVTASAVKQLAVGAGLEVLQPPRLSTPDVVDALAALEAHCLVVAAYGLLLPSPVLELTPLGCINVHASLLPRWRGAAPIQRAIEAGDTETGICIMHMERGLDTGGVYLSRSTPIRENDTAGTLHDRLAELGAEVLLEALPGIEAGTLRPQPQDEAAATYADKIQKSEAHLDWHADAALLARRVRAFNPWPGAWTLLPASRAPRGGTRLRVLAAHALTEAPGAPPGSVVSADAHDLRIACGRGQLRLDRVQRAGGKPLDSAEALRGLAIRVGDRFE